MATIRDVAELAGVSISTVSLALNTPERVSPDTRARIEEAARKVGFSANPLAQNLKRGRSRLIAIVVADITNPFFGRLLREIERHASDADHMVVVNDTQGEAANERAILQHLIDQRVAGVILAPHCIDGANRDIVNSLPMPCVLFDHRLEGSARDFVGTDNILASAMLTEHLVRLGHRRIGFIGGIAGLYTAEQRRIGHERTLLANGLPVQPEMQIDGRYDLEGGYAAAMQFLTRGTHRPTAIVAASNVMAIGALQACNELGVGCPSDLSLTGIDDVPWSKVIRPRITSAIQPIEDIAHAACRLLFECMAAPPSVARTPREVIFLPRLVMGESTCPPRVDHMVQGA